jgi:hypothetical protein
MLLQIGYRIKRLQVEESLYRTLSSANVPNRVKPDQVPVPLFRHYYFCNININSCIGTNLEAAVEIVEAAVEVFEATAKV